MADYDIHIKGGTVVDGTRAPRYHGDIWIRDGKVAQIGGRSPGFATRCGSLRVRWLSVTAEVHHPKPRSSVNATPSGSSSETRSPNETTNISSCELLAWIRAKAALATTPRLVLMLLLLSMSSPTVTGVSSPEKTRIGCSRRLSNT